jgi:[acyl-carrier-protein] S-malonyltransferase
MKKRIVVICPGRGSYTKETLGHLEQNGGHVTNFIQDIDARRKSLGEPTITELDSADAFKTNLHTKGEHASPLIYACSYADFMAIDRERFEIVAITGNSMGWYLTLAFGQSLDWAGGFEVINTMGSMMKNGIVGGQVIYPVCDGNWLRSKEQLELVEKTVSRLHGRDGCEVHTSIHLGGYIVLGANKPGVAALLKELPKIEDYPFQLINHAAFHTPLLAETSERAFEVLPQSLFAKPQVPLIDGRGWIWQPHSTDVCDLYRYTLGHQVTKPYDFSMSISVALKEFAPDHLVLLGPGSSLGGSIGQILIENDWIGLKSKDDFTTRQKSNSPFLIAMGRPDQRPLVTSL